MEHPLMKDMDTLLLTLMEDKIILHLPMEDILLLLLMEVMNTLLQPMEVTAPLCMEVMEDNGMLLILPMEDI